MRGYKRCEMIRKLNRHVIIAGTPRSGKTTLCLELAKFGFLHYRMDPIKRALCEICKWDPHDWDSFTPKMAKIIETILKESKSDTVYSKEYYAIDTCHLYPKDVSKIRDEALIIYLGYKDTSPKEKVIEMRKHDESFYWCKNLSDEKLERMALANINLSKKLAQECKKYNIQYFDTSYKREEVLKEALDYVLENCAQ